MGLTHRQRQVLDYLDGKDWTSPTEVGRKVWGWPRHSSTSSPVLKKLTELGFVERSDKGHYRLPKKKKGRV